MSNKTQKIQILTLVPDSWPLKKLFKELEVSKAKARKSRGDTWSTTINNSEENQSSYSW